MSKGGTEIDQACDSCRMPGFCAIIVLAFTWGVKLFDYAVDGGKEGGDLRGPGWREKAKWGIWPQDGGIKPSGRHVKFVVAGMDSSKAS